MERRKRDMSGEDRTGKIISMLDLAFVRANLPLVEEKLRARNMDPAVVLGDFVANDEARRSAITRFELLKGQINRLAEVTGQAKRAKQEDATDTKAVEIINRLWDEGKMPRAQVLQMEATGIIASGRRAR